MVRGCGGCRLPATQRALVLDLARQRTPLRTISERLAEKGHSLSKDAVRRHIAHAAPEAEVGSPVRTQDPVSTSSTTGAAAGGLLVAQAAADVLTGWPSLAIKLTARLVADELLDEARTVLAVVPELMRPALPASPEPSPSCACGTAC